MRTETLIFRGGGLANAYWHKYELNYVIYHHPTEPAIQYADGDYNCLVDGRWHNSRYDVFNGIDHKCWALQGKWLISYDEK